jgi:hypothetical protein
MITGYCWVKISRLLLDATGNCLLVSACRDRVEDCVFGDKDVESNKAKGDDMTMNVSKEDTSDVSGGNFMSRSLKKAKSAATAGISADIHDTVSTTVMGCPAGHMVLVAVSSVAGSLVLHAAAFFEVLPRSTFGYLEIRCFAEMDWMEYWH